MSDPLSVLILEDSEFDAELILYELRRSGYQPDWRRVDNELDYLNSLSSTFDIILADYSLPQFDALQALKLLKSRGLAIPFIIVTGTVGEEVVAECMRLGAKDYLLKDRLGRLGSSVERVLQEKHLNDEKQQVENALRENEEKYRSLFESSPESITLVGLDGTILDCNDATAIIAGLPRHKLIGKAFLDMGILDEADIPSIMERFAKIVSGELYEPFQLKVIPSDNRVVWLEIYLALLEREGEVYAIQVIARDITDQKQTEVERESLIQKLEVQNAELERFAYTVSHDLKSPLITIGGFLGFLEEDAMNGNMKKLKEDIQRINNATVKMKCLLDELLELSRIGRLMNQPEDVPFGEIVRDALERLEGQLSDGKVQVEVSNDLPIIHGDRARLVEVVQNLVENATKFMGNQPKPKIEIGVEKEKVGDVFFVRDNGIGIDPKYHESIFGLFNKLDPNIKGTGIGLALVKRIIEVHGGRIWVESEVGEGSTFYFTLLRTLTSQYDITQDE
jgi:PAS domain S-box-containing protein